MNRILVICTRQIGDVLLTTPLVRAVRRRWPQAWIAVLGFRGTLGMLAGNPDVNELIETPPRPGLRGTSALARRLWRRFDLALVADAGDRAHLLGWIAAPERSGIVPEAGGSNWWKRRVLRHHVVASGDRGEVHVVDEKVHLLTPWIDQATPEWPEVVPPEPAPLPPELQQALQPRFVVVHAPSMWAYKQWPLPHYEDLVRRLLDRGWQVVLTGSASPRDQDCVAPLRALGSPPALLDTSGRLDFRQLAALLRQTALYIGPDTSVSHLAAACGTPVVAVFGPTNPRRWAPWPGGNQPLRFVRREDLQQVGNVSILQSGLPCVPCGRAGCEDHRDSRSDCLVAITPDRVFAEAERRLATP